MAKNKLTTILYSALFVLTAGFIIALSVWAALGSTAGTKVNYIDGELALEETVRTEFLVGEEISTEGITLKVGKKTYSSDELEITVDNTSAGEKMAEVYHESGNDRYRAYFPVRYLAVRHIDIRQKPTEFIYDESGNVTGFADAVIWAELSSQPTAFEQPDEEGLDTVIILEEGMYSLIPQSKDANGVYGVTIVCGQATSTLLMVDAGEGFLYLDSRDRVLTFTNMSGTEDSLVLFVTKIESDSNDGENGAEGYYRFKRADGTYAFLRFAYYLDSYTQSHFMSWKFYEGVGEEQVGDDYEITFGGVRFHADKLPWHKAILNWDF